MKSVCILSSVHDALDNRVYYREARSLQRAGYDVTLIALHDRDEVKDGIRIWGLPHVRRWQRPKLWLTLLRHALKERADVYHFHDPKLLLVAPWLRLLTGRPTIYDVHEIYADFVLTKTYIPASLRGPVAWLLRWLEPLLGRLQSAFIFADDQIAASFSHIRRPKATLFNYPERAFVEHAIARTSGLQERESIILHLGGHKQGRGVQLMVDAFRLVLQALPQARLWLVGPFHPPALAHQVRAELAQRGMEQAVTLAGQVPFEQVGGYLKRAAIGWIPLEPIAKYQKNIPTKLFEYMAYGVPVVSSDLASIEPFLRNGECGYRVTPDDPQSHAEAILNILSQPRLAAAMGARGQELVRTRYNWDEMEKRLLALYEEVLHPGGKPVCGREVVPT